MKMMMRLIAAMLIAVICLTGSALAAGKIRTEGSVNLRKGPGLDYDTRGTVSAGKVLSFDKTAKDARGVIWYRLSSGKGWISSKYTCQIEGSASSAKSGTVKATGNVNLRKGPGLDYGDIGTMKKGDTATYKGETQKDARGVAWYKVSFNGKTGWVSSKYGRLNK